MGVRREAWQKGWRCRFSRRRGRRRRSTCYRGRGRRGGRGRGGGGGGGVNQVSNISIMDLLNKNYLFVQRMYVLFICTMFKVKLTTYTGLQAYYGLILNMGSVRSF